MSERIIVKGNIFAPPLLDTTKANVIEFRGANGELEALVTRVLSDSMWCFCSNKDPDWTDTLMRHGYTGPQLIVR